jgi:Tol biopolymer transport system component
MARSPLLRPAGLLCVAALALPTAAAAQDSAAPDGADPSWLPNEEWVNQLWLPFDEQRLERVLGKTRGEIFRWTRIDASNTLAQLGRRRGMSADEVARKLVAPRRPKLSERRYREVRSHAKRIVTQGHMAQHFLFHALHQTAISGNARRIFGVRDRQQFFELRRAEISPLGIGELNGRTRVQMRRDAGQALRDAATRGVNTGLMTPLQGRITLERQLRQLPRWLGQSRYNGPTAGANRPDLPPGDTAKHPTITADGSRAVWDAYRATIYEAERRGEIHVQAAATAGSSLAAVSPAVRPESRRPYSAYNAIVSADGSAAVFETAQSTFPLAKRVGQMSVVVRDLATGGVERVSHLALPAGAPTRSAFNPSISANGTLVAFEATDTARRGSESRNGLWIYDRTKRTQTLVIDHGPDGAAFLPKLSGDGGAVAFSDVEAGGSGRTLVYVRSLRDATTTLVSRADGADGAVAESDAYEPAISDDGTIVAFTTRAANLGARGNTSRIFVRDLRSGTTRLVSGGVPGDAIQPALSADGRYVAFVARRRAKRVTPRTLRATIWLHDRVNATTTLVSRADGASGALANGYSSEPAVAADGARVVFTSTAGNLAKRKPLGLAGVFVRDLGAGTTRMLSERGPVRRGRAATRALAAATRSVRTAPYICPLWRQHL